MNSALNGVVYLHMLSATTLRISVFITNHFSTFEEEIFEKSAISFKIFLKNNIIVVLFSIIVW